MSEHENERFLIDYDSLKMAEELANLSPHSDGPAWAEDEGIDYEDLQRFAMESASDSITIRMVQMCVTDPRTFCSLYMLGMIIGIRYANLINRDR